MDEQRASNGGASTLAWLLTYGDLMTLLFALFVLIISFSEIDSEKFKKNAQAYAEAFNQDKPDTLIPEEVEPEEEIEPTIFKTATISDEKKLLLHLRRSLKRKGLSDKVSVDLEGEDVLVTLPSDYSFLPGSAQLKFVLLPALEVIARSVAFGTGKITIFGHTDSDPISTAQFRSNWDLSSARAISVLHYLENTGLVDRKRLSAIGYAETRPLVKEDIPGGKAMNRRVEIRLKSSSPKAPEDGKAEVPS